LRGLPAAWGSLSQLWQVCVRGKWTEAVVVGLWLETVEKACLCMEYWQ